MKSIRATLLWGTLATLIVVLGGSGLLGFAAGRHEAEELFDARLAASARVLESLVARPLDAATVEPAVVIELPKLIAFQLWRDDGPQSAQRLLARSASAPDTPFAPLSPGFSRRQIGKHTWRVFVLSSGSAWIQVAEREDERVELTKKLALAGITPPLLGALLLFALLSLLIRYGLAPLSELARRLETRKPEAMLPVQLERAPAEVVPVVAALNGLLGRTREAFERERRFIDAAAHELRTPLAALKIHAQNAAAAEDEQLRRNSMARMLDGLDRTTHLASQMLAYSRITGPAAKPAEQQLSLRAIVGEALDQMRHAAGNKGQQIVFDGGAEGDAYSLSGDPAQLASLVRNLVDNASHYSPADSTIRVRLSRALDRSIHFEVIDSGTGIPPELRERVFESYFRIPGSAGSGSGLGLAIVREIAHRHGGRVGIDSPEQGIGTRVHVIFDAAGTQAGALKAEPDPADRSP